MPARTTVEAFIARVISGDHVGAIRDWYHDDAWMQENQAPPRQGGREALMQREAAMMERSQSVKTELLGGPMIEGPLALHLRLQRWWQTATGRGRLANLAR
jgi:hypothetical protein